jgi:hypothetical protein
MFWVVGGTGRKTDHKQFQTALKDGIKHPTKGDLVQQFWAFDSRRIK